MKTVQINQLAKYLKVKGHFVRKSSSGHTRHTNSQTHTHSGLSALAGPLKRSVVISLNQYHLSDIADEATRL